MCLNYCLDFCFGKFCAHCGFNWKKQQSLLNKYQLNMFKEEPSCSFCGGKIFFPRCVIFASTNHFVLHLFSLLFFMLLGYIGYQFHPIGVLLWYTSQLYFTRYFLLKQIANENIRFANRLIESTQDHEIRFWPWGLSHDIRQHVLQRWKKEQPIIQKKQTKKKQLLLPVREAVWTKEFHSQASGPCPICRNNIITCFQFHCAHIIPMSKGGTNTIENLRPVCASCNLSMGSKNLTDFQQEIQETLLFPTKLK